jgi:hypothetical protein
VVSETLRKSTESLEARLAKVEERELDTSSEKGAPLDRPSDVTTKKDFCGLPLRFLPDIRKSDIILGEGNKFLKLFGLSKRTWSIMTFYKGPNKKLNRYLNFQYTRLVKSIGGQIKTDKVYSKLLNRNVVTRSIIWKVKLRDMDTSGMTRAQKKMNKTSIRKFWAIAMNLIVNSQAYRLVLMTKVLGKKERWFHRDIKLLSLAFLNYSYLKIVKRGLTTVPMYRT